MQDVNVLFRPGAIGGLTLRNRIVMAPMTRHACLDGSPTQEVVEYYRRRAAGGVGLIIGEASLIDHVGAMGHDEVPFMYGPALHGWSSVVRAVHVEGAKIFSQLWHTGAVRKLGLAPRPDLAGYSPSGLNSPGSPHGQAMTLEDIEDVIRAYAAAALASKEAGFDGVELHGAHGYLIDQFLWSSINVRNDQYGGCPANRVRFATEVVAACRAAVGPTFPIVMRLSQWKQQDFSVRIWSTPEELSETLCPLVDAGVDAFHPSTRRYAEPAFEGSNMSLAGWMKQLSRKPTIAVGGISLSRDFMEPGKLGVFNSAQTQDIAELIERMNSAEFDFFALGRALIANPDWPTMVRQGKFTELRDFGRDMLSSLQ